MLSVEEVKKLIRDENIPDEQAERIRSELYELADLAFETWLEEQHKKAKTKYAYS